MAVEVLFPATDLTTTVGQVTKWLKSEGDKVEKGEVLAEVQTEKVVFEVESPASGVLGRILVPIGIEVPVLTVLAVITAAGEALPEKYSTQQPPAATTLKGAAFKEAPVQQPRGPDNRRPGETALAVPLVRKLASESGIDLATISGTGPGGRITKEDVLNAIESKKKQPSTGVQTRPSAGEEVTPLSPMRRIIAQRMTESFRSPHFYLTLEVDAQQMGETRKQLLPVIEKKTGVKLTHTDLIIKATARALADNPSVNCAYVDGSARVSRRIDIGLVVSVEGGLVVPVIRGAGEKSLVEIAQARDSMAKKARDRKLTADEMKGSTFTISNLGMFGVDWFSAILQPPEAAILAVGRIADRAVVINGQIVARPIMTLTLSIDHRVLDGVLGAQFLQSLKYFIENPAALLL